MPIRRESAQSIVDEMKAAIHRDINIMDADGVILASTNPARQGQLHQGALRIIREGLASLVIQRDLPEMGVQRGINLPIRIGGRLEGVIGITGAPEEVSAFGDVIKRMTELMLENIHHQEQRELLERAKGLFVENWLFAGQPDWAELETRGRLLGLDIRAPYTVALLGLAEEAVGEQTRTEELREMRSGHILEMIRNRLRGEAAHFCAVIRSAIIVLLRSSERNRDRALVRDICRDIESYYGLPVTAGVSGASESPADVRRCYTEAKAAQAIAAQAPGGRVLFYDQASLEFIVQSVPLSIRQALGERIFSACTPQERAEFARTVWAYFEWDGDIRLCAEHLFIHRNTFQYRMDRLRQKTGRDLKTPKDAWLLYLTLLDAPS